MEALVQVAWVGFIGGLLSFAHCLGMCGGFFLHLSLRDDDRRHFTDQALWIAGKLFSYLFLGAAAGYAGSFLGDFLTRHTQLQNLLSFAAGGVILVMGLTVLGLIPVSVKSFAGLGEGIVVAMARDLFTGKSAGSALTLGLATGFLPCPIILAFLAYAMQSGSVLSGLVTMGALSLGTTLPLVLVGTATRLCGIHLRSWAPRAGGLILIVLGLATALRGAAPLHHLLGCPSERTATLDSAASCCLPSSPGPGHGR